MKIPILARQVVFGTALILPLGCSAPEPKPPEPPTVTIARPLRRDVVDYAEFTGTTKAVQTLEVRARVEGELLSVAKYTAEDKEYTGEKEEDFTEGTVVEEGALLFAIEPDVYRARLDKAARVRDQAVTRVNLTAANLVRDEELYQKRVMPRADYDKSVAERDAARADLAASEADIRQTKIDLGYTEIRAPFSGRVGRRLVDLGNLVGAGESTLLTTIQQTKPMYAYFDVNEQIVLRIQRWRREHGARTDKDEPMKVYLGLADEKGCPHEGVLDFVDNAVDPTTGTALVRGVFPNDDGLLYPGLFVNLRIPGETIKDALLVNERALGTDLEGKYLLLVGDDDIVEKRRVEIGPLIDGMRVIRENLRADDRYILKGLQRARPELPVKPVDAAESEVAPPEPGADQSPQTPSAKQTD
ncbi:MAG: efflux RND transporter periplasmic adaptor subunit [Planctomycetota bacterium]